MAYDEAPLLYHAEANPRSNVLDLEGESYSICEVTIQTTQSRTQMTVHRPRGKLRVHNVRNDLEWPRPSNAVVFLPSRVASFITDTNLVVDGVLTRGVQL